MIHMLKGVFAKNVIEVYGISNVFNFLSVFLSNEDIVKNNCHLKRRIQ